jgi:hypothetical protein
MSGIRQEAGGHDADVAVDGGDALVGVLFEQFGGDEFFEGEDHAVGAADSDGGAPVFDRFDGVFDLEVAAVWGEDAVGEVVAGAY